MSKDWKDTVMEQQKDQPLADCFKSKKQIIYDAIKAKRAKLGISQLKLAEMAGVKESTLIRNLKGETDMSLGTLLMICEALNIKGII